MRNQVSETPLERGPRQKPSSTYQCGNCLETLLVCNSDFYGVLQEIRKEPCPGCGSLLSESLVRDESGGQSESSFWVHGNLTAKTPTKEPLPVVFTPAITLYGLRSSVRLVDDLVGGLKQDSVLLLKGSSAVTEIAEKYCLRSQLPERLGGLGGRAYFLDAGNSFDVYLFATIAKEYALDIDSSLNRVVITRAFTAYELLQLAKNDVWDVFQNYNPQLLVVSDVFKLLTQDIEQDEGVRIAHGIGRAIRKVSAERHVPIVVTATTPARHLERVLEDYCDSVLELSRTNQRISINLTKHPSKAWMSAVQDLIVAHNQSIIAPASLAVDG